MRFGENPPDFAVFIREYLSNHYGLDAWYELRDRQAEIFKLTTPLKRDIYQNLKNSLSWMQAQRREGVEGRLEFSSPYVEVEAV